MFRAMQFAFVSVVILAIPAFVQAEMIDGSLVNDHFTYGTTYDPGIWYDQYVNNSSSITFDPSSPGTVKLDGTLAGNCRLKSQTISFPDTWGVEVRFMMTGKLDNTNGLSASPFNSSRFGEGGIDLGVCEDGSGASGNTYTLTWGSQNSAGNVAIQTGLNKDTYYTVVAFLKDDGDVDIYLDGDLISTQTAFAGTPYLFFVGDTNTNVEAHMIVDYIKVGGLVPEPSSLVMVGMGLLGLLAYAWRKRK